MKNIRCLFLMLSMLLMGGLVTAQKNVLTGKVVDKKTGEALNGVTILTSNKKSNVTTKEDGSFSIPIKAGATTLIFSYVGYATQTVDVDGKTSITVAMVPVVKTNDEVVVIGYGTQKKSSVTGAVSKYKNEHLDEAPVARLDQALQGKIAGVYIQNSSSEAGADPKIRVRGLSSVNAGGDPLVVVDGVPVPDGLAFVNMADVESVEVLKDAASAAIYGSRGASGVILITTKSGKADKPKYSLKASTGEKSSYSTYSRMTTAEYVNLLFYEDALRKTDTTYKVAPASTISPDDIATYLLETNLHHGVVNNWQADALRAGKVKNLQLNISGGSKEVKYFISAGYQNDQGSMYHSENERYNIRTKIDAQLSKKIKFSLNINPSYIRREKPSVSFTDFVRYPTWMPVFLNEEQAQFIRANNPLYPDVKAGDYAQARYWSGIQYSGTLPDGTVWAGSTNVQNPFSTATNSPMSQLNTRTSVTNDYRVTNAADLTINLMPGLNFKSLLSANILYGSGLDFAQKNSSRSGEVSKGIYTSKLSMDILNENTFTYNKKIKQHSFNLLVGFTAQKTTVKDQQITGLNYISDQITTLNSALYLDNKHSFNTINKIGLLSYLSRFTYSFADKYLLAASFRTDGSSYFAPNRKWGQFPSISLGWVASKEKFMSNISWIDNLKFRGSFGATGNNKIANFAFDTLLYAANYAYGANNGSVVPGLVQSPDIISNPNITWERTFQFNGGADLSLFNGVVDMTFDIFQSKTDQLLLKQSVMGFAGVPLTWNNIGRVQTDGFELEINTNNVKRKGFSWTTSANISHTANKVLQLGDESLILNQGERNEVYMNKVGAPLIQFYGYKTNGIWLSDAEILAAQNNGLTSALTSLFKPGGLKIVDLNGDNRIDYKDRTVIGNPYPDFTWGITNNFKFNHFDLNVLVQGVQGGSLINGDPNYTEYKRTNRSYNTNRWVSPMFPGDGKTPYSTVGFDWMLTDYVVESASYFAVRELMLGYTFTPSKVKRAKLNSLRMYFSAQNIFYHAAAGYRGLNPEARMTSNEYNTPLVEGYQRGAFPVNKTFQLGVDLTF